MKEALMPNIHQLTLLLIPSTKRAPLASVPEAPPRRRGAKPYPSKGMDLTSVLLCLPSFGWRWRAAQIWRHFFARYHLPDTFAICRLNADAAIPDWATEGFSSVTRTSNELSIVCLQSHVPDSIKHEKDWRCFQLEGPILFTMVGVLSSLIQPLAEAGISVFAVSTFDTDYVLVKAADVGGAIKAWRGNGYQFT